MSEPSLEDAEATVQFAILNEFITHAPKEAVPYLQLLSRIATQAVKERATAWAFEQLAKEHSP